MDRKTKKLLSTILTKAAEIRPDDVAVVCGKEVFTYAEFNTRVIRLANVLTTFGVHSQDRIAIIHKNCHYFLECYWACAYIGAVLVPINYRLTAQDFAYILDDSEAILLLTHPEYAEKIYQIQKYIKLIKNIIWTAEIDTLFNDFTNHIYDDLLQQSSSNKPQAKGITENSIAQIYYTSGTTGKPKGVVLTHKNNYIHADGTIDELNLNYRDRWLHVSPMFHLADAWAVWAITKAGGCHVLIPEFDPEIVLKTIEESKITISNLIPTMLNILVNFPNTTNFDLSSFRLVMSGGAPIAPEIVRKIIQMFQCEYIQTYGMTETSPFLTMSILKPHLKKLPFEEQLEYIVTTGRVFTTIEMMVIDKHGKCVANNNRDVGEIIVKGDTITPYYWKLPQETETRIVDGWLYTGDLATVDQEGYVTIVDRKNDMIITGGENVYSIEVENILYMHPAILEAAVIGIPDDILGERIKAVVVLKPGKSVTEKELITFCKQYLAHFKAPKSVQFVDELPKTGSKKISKHMLRCAESEF